MKITNTYIRANNSEIKNILPGCWTQEQVEKVTAAECSKFIIDRVFVDPDNIDPDQYTVIDHLDGGIIFGRSVIFNDGSRSTELFASCVE